MLQSTVSPGLVQDAPKPPLVMPPEVESGRHWNLTADQEVKLKAMWAALFDIFGVKHERGQGEEAATPVQKKKWSSLLPRLGSGQQDDNMSSDGYESANKQDYSTAITTYSPEQLREAFWAMPKSLHPDELLLRFLRARKWNVQAAVFMFIPAITWINQEMDVHNDLLLRGEEHAVQQTTSTDAAERAEAQGFMAQLRTGKWFVHGTDNCGRPCLYIKAKLHHQSEQSADCLVRSIVYLIEMMRMMMPSPVDMATVIFDLADSGWANIDWAPIKFIISDQHYPETLGKVILYRAPWFFSGVWRTIKGWLEPDVACKVHIAATVAELEEHIPRHRIMKDLGGDEEYTYGYVEPREGENSVMDQTARRGEILEERNELIKSFERETVLWIENKTDGKSRDATTQQLARNYWDLDPFIRARSFYDRIGVTCCDGKVDFYPGK